MRYLKEMALALALASTAGGGTAMAQDSAIERIAQAAFTAAERQLIVEFYRSAGLPDPIYPVGGSGNPGGGHGAGGGNSQGQGHGGGLPPGLQRQLDRTGSLPPGLERQLQRNGTLPPGLQAQLLPNTLYQQLPPRVDDYEIKRVGQQVVLLDAATQVILDIIDLAAGQ